MKIVKQLYFIIQFQTFLLQIINIKMEVKQTVRLKLRPKNPLNNSSTKQLKQLTKRKNITKQSYAKPEVKLMKINSQKNDKKNTKQKKNQTTIHDADITRAFRVHSQNYINFYQCLTSLRLLGCQLPQQNGSEQFVNQWQSKGTRQIDFSTFQKIYLEMSIRNHNEQNEQIFEHLSQNKQAIDLETLTKVFKKLKCKGSPELIISAFGIDGKISFQEFNRISNMGSALGSLKD